MAKLTEHLEVPIMGNFSVHLGEAKMLHQSCMNKNNVAQFELFQYLLFCQSQKYRIKHKICSTCSTDRKKQPTSVNRTLSAHTCIKFIV